MKPAEQNRVPMSHETGHNSTVLECNFIRTCGGLSHRMPGDQISFLLRVSDSRIHGIDIRAQVLTVSSFVPVRT
jgi:hypothetical protein